MEEEKNYLRVRTIIEVLGKPKEHVEKALRKYVEQIKKDEDLSVLKEDYSDAKEQEDLFSMFTELEFVVKSIPKLVSFCFNYMPSSLEIIKPESLSIKNTKLSNILNDLQAKLHNVDMVAKKLKNENDFLKKNLKISLKNVVSVILAIKKQGTIEEISKLSGIDAKALEGFLEELIKEGKIKKEENLYILV